MSDVTGIESAPMPVVEAKVKAKIKPKKMWPEKLASVPEPKKLDFEFAGRVTSINVNGAGPNSYQFLFTLENKKGKDNAYLLDPAEPMRFNAMASLLCAAYAAGAKVHIRKVPSPSGPAYAAELEVHAKP